MMKYYIGIDLGGTNIATGVVDENYHIVGTGKRKTKQQATSVEIIEDMAAAAKDAVKDAGLSMSDISGCGVGSPGSIDTKNGLVCYSNNIDVNLLPMRDMIEERLNVPTYIANDANAAALGEMLCGAGKGTNSFVTITLGTGVGGGVIMDNNILVGDNCAGGELGHTVLVYDGEQCTCGRKGCWEAYASASALIRQTKAKMESNKDSIMWKIAKDSGGKVNGRTAFDAMRAGDKAGKEVVDQYINYVAAGVTNMVNIFQPEVLCIGGGISKEGETLLKPIREFVERERYSKNIEKQTEIKAATLGNDAGIIGAAFLHTLFE